MKHLFYFTILATIVSLVSCKKDTVSLENSLIIGATMTKLIITDVEPDTLLSSFHVKSEYPIDVNGDGHDDFNLTVYNEYIFGGMVLMNSELRIETLNSESFVLMDDGYPKVLAHGDTLTSNGNWTSGDLLLLHSYEGCCPPTGISYHDGPWKDQDEKYIGLRYKERLGWIKTGVLSYRSIKVYEYALQE